MKSSLWRVVLVLLTVCSALVVSTSAQDAPTSYAGGFLFDFPEGFAQQGDASDEYVQIVQDEAAIAVYGPPAYNQVLAGQTFAEPAAALRFFAERVGFTVGDDVTTGLPENGLARVAVELGRRNQRGLATLVDLQNGRSAVVVALGNPRIDADAYAAVLASLVYPADLVDIAVSNADFSTLVAAVQAAGLEETLRGGEFTVFAPTNAAFEEALAALNVSAEDLLANTDLLTQVLTYHVVPARVLAADLSAGDVATVQGDPVVIRLRGGSARVNNANIAQTDIEARNGVIHVIDKVLLPPDVAAAQIAPTLPELLEQTDPYNGRFTFTYPVGFKVEEGEDFVSLTNARAAFNFIGPASLAQVLGGTTQPDDAAKLAFFLDRNNYTLGDALETPEGALAAVNVALPRRNQAGAAYLVDLQNGRQGVLVALAGRDGLSLALRDYLAPQLLTSWAYPADIVDIAVSNPDFSTLVAAVQAAGLEETLRGGEFTVFAPTNAAFAAALADLGLTAEALLADTATLTSVLTYHVVEGTVLSGDLTAGDVPTVQGDTVAISLEGGVKVNDANVVQADITAYNGVIHVIDKVLLPPDVEALRIKNTVFADLDQTDDYSGRFSFSYPVGAQIEEGEDFVTVSLGEADINVVGPTAFSSVLGGTTQPDDAAKLAFYLNRNNFVVGEPAEAPEGTLAAVNVALPRRSQAGTAYLVDLGNGRQGVIVALTTRDGFSIASRDFVLPFVLGSWEYPPDIVDVAIGNPDFSTLVSAVQAAGLVDTLRGGEFTVFAPTNDAFAAALAALGFSAEDLLGNTELLSAILTYHVVEGRVTSADLVAGDVATVQGAKLTINLDDGVKVNDATVITPDVAAYNGVIHVIDSVLVPPLCEVVVERQNVRIRLGPGQERAALGFMPTGTLIPVTGQVTVANELWYRLDPELAAPGRDFEEAWVIANAVTASGLACDIVPVVGGS